MRRFVTGILIVMAMTVLTGCFIAGPVPYAYSPVYCSGCWYGTWEGREGWHYGGEAAREREAPEDDTRARGTRATWEPRPGHRSDPLSRIRRAAGRAP